jgi:hypothetical protein
MRRLLVVARSDCGRFPLTQSTTLLTYCLGATRKHRYSCGNPITRRGISVPIGRQHHHLEMMASHGPQTMMSAEVAQPIQSFRRIRDPYATRYQHPPRAAPLGYAPRAWHPGWQKDSSPLQYPLTPEGEVSPLQRYPLHHHQYYLPETAMHYRHLHDEPEWGESSVAASVNPIEYSNQDMTPRPRRPPPPRFMMQHPRGIARFQRTTEIHDMEAAEAEWQNCLVDEASKVVNTETIDPQTLQRDLTVPQRFLPQPTPDYRTQCPFPGFSRQRHTEVMLPNENLKLPSRPPSDRRHRKPCPPIQILPQRDSPAHWELQIPPAPRHQSQMYGADRSFSFDRPASGTSVQSWEHLDDNPGVRSLFQRHVPELEGEEFDQSCNEFTIERAPSFSQEHILNSRNSLHLGRSTGHDRFSHKAPVDLKQLPPLRFFNNDMEVDVYGSPFPQHESPPSKRIKAQSHNSMADVDLFGRCL